jgi:protein-disulfide isomerase
MPLTRRLVLTMTPALLASRAWADDDITRAERFIGKPDAKATVNEYFSLTCTHCAAFSMETMPNIRKNLIDTGQVKWVYHDYPLDQVALLAAQVARYLPVDRYDPFINALFATQNSWAFSRGADPKEQLWKTAALAGMSKPTFDKAVSDDSLRNWILQQQQADTNQWKIDSTPSFVINNQKYAGEMSYDAFRKLIPA